MTDLTPELRAALSRAVAAGYPFALWRPPYGEAFSLVVGLDAPVEVAVFDAIPVPGFVMAPFDGVDGNLAWLIPADVALLPGGYLYRDGITLGGQPVTDAQRAFAALPQGAPVRAAPDALPAPDATPRAEYEARVARAVAEIERGGVDKIVLSRIEPRDLAPDHDLADLAEALARVHPHAFVSLVSSAPTGTWLTATPEVLLESSPGGLGTMALAGTQWPEAGTDIATLTWPQKIVDEQALVSEFIRAAFIEAGISGVSETPAATVQAANLCHLRSDFTAPAADPAQLADLLRRLHPTSAVCGMPKAPARDFILAEEGTTRGFYTGYLGPRGIDGCTALYVNLRSARVSGGRIFLHVGGGIVAASDPALEYDETVAKTRTIAMVL